MMKKFLLFLVVLLCGAKSASAEEKLLYSTDFQDWEAVATEAATVDKTTDFSNETLTFCLNQVHISPTSVNESRFNYDLVSAGWAQAQKTPGSFIELSPLASITRIRFIEGATGSNRGYKVWKKNASDADWVLLYEQVINPSSGMLVELAINDTDVALKFTNIDETQNAYMFDLEIYGDYVSNLPQKTLNVSSNIEGAGTITQSPNSDTYDEGSSVEVLATPNFGYDFVEWQDVNGNPVTTDNPYTVTLNTDVSLKAVFVEKETFALNLEVSGSLWGEVELSPEPVGGKYEAGTQVLLKVNPNAVTSFSYWDNGSTSTERSLTMNSDQTVIATFDEIPFIVGWDFEAQEPRSNRAGDFYSSSSNQGIISIYEPDGNTVNWLANASSFSPSYPSIRFWTPGSEFKTRRRYLQAQLSTVGHENIKVHSMVGGNYQVYSEITLQYSVDGTNFNEVARVDISDVHNSGWKDLNVQLPSEASGKEMLYLRWEADETSTIVQEGSDNDGTAFTNIFVYADAVIQNDDQAPVLISTVPASDATNASVTGSVVLTFDEKVQPGSGEITLGDQVLTGTFGSKTASFSYERLDYNTSYTFTVPSGSLTDLSGNPYEGTSFTFTTRSRTAATKKMFDAVVALDGSGDYMTVTDAIENAPSSSAFPWVIFVKNGKYTGHHLIPITKPNLHVIGQSREGVIISDNRLSGDDGNGSPVYHVSEGATMVVEASDIYFENITFENSYGYENQSGPQALALYTNNDRIGLKNCYLRSYQDTYLTSTRNLSDRHYLNECKIEGAVDYIYGGGDVLFDDCVLNNMRKDGGYIVAPSHEEGTAWGYVFNNCILDGADGVTTYYGRPWKNAPKAVFLNSTLKVDVYASGWYYKMGAIPAVFADYGTMDQAGNPVDLSQRISDYEYEDRDTGETITGTAKNNLTDEEAAAYTYGNIMLRSGDDWDPRFIMDAPQAPQSLSISENTLSWEDNQYARLYIVFRDNQFQGFTTEPSYVDQNIVAGETYVYAVQAVSDFGALSFMSNTLTVVDGVPKVSLLLSTNNQSAGTVSQSPIAEKYDINTEITVTAQANAGYKFVGWYDQNDQLVSEINPHTFTLSTDAELMGKFAAQYSLSATVNDVSFGSVSISPNQESYDEGTEVIVEAVPATGYVFLYWQDENAQKISENNPLKLTMYEDQSVQAVLISEDELVYYSLTASSTLAEAGSVSVDPAMEQYLDGTIVKVTATASDGYRFVSWLDEGGVQVSTQNPLDVTMDANKTLSAEFVKTFYLDVQLSDGLAGQVDKSINKTIFDEGTEVTLTAVANEGYRFSHWSDATGNDISTDASISLVMDQDQQIKAVFVALFTVELLEVGDNSGTLAITSPSDYYEAGATIELVATPAEGYEFVEWKDINGVFLSDQNPWSMKVERNIRIRAIFEMSAVLAAGIEVDDVIVYGRDKQLFVKGLIEGDQVAVYSMSGVLLEKQISTGSLLTMDVVSGIIIVRIIKEGEQKVIKTWVD
ncbi:pectinesterase family protein [Reichenbachiella ulvae]|uniref:Pectinesterase family protein n=1 Tax=Reichenbachiella ulvae TaxID=2980104 RepID=A0ABT3CYQ1_9BACT|nr:pectinesterase family protein [Reichenbachiella ulvae]MCV9388825.1 pectinesterase family protein [Reichenbachiella ulvae]